MDKRRLEYTRVNRIDLFGKTQMLDWIHTQVVFGSQEVCICIDDIKMAWIL